MTSLAPNFDVREEIRLLQVLEPFRPVGPEKHFYLASILQEHGLIEPLCRRSTLWSFISKLYDLEKLNDLHYLQLVKKYCKNLQLISKRSNFYY